MENQFFVSGTASELKDQAKDFDAMTNKSTDEVTNKIGEALVERVLRAITACKKDGGTQDFRIVIINPLWPGMSSAVVDSVGIQTILAWQQKTINKGKNSIYQRLRAKFTNHRSIEISGGYPNADFALPNPKKSPAHPGSLKQWGDFLEEEKIQFCLEKYIKFFTLRQHDKRPLKDGVDGCDGYAVTEQIYVHSKLLIVDDRTVIIGSANINDRSLHGDRDSEVCVITGPAHEKRDTKEGGNVCPGDEDRQDDMLEPGQLHKCVDPQSMKKIKMFGKDWRATHFAHTLRVHLWAEHMGRLKDGHIVEADVAQDLQDPGISFTQFLRCGETNTKIYDKVFPDSPNNQHRKLKDLQDCIDKRNGDTYPKPKEEPTGHKMLLFAQKRLLSQMKGHICTTSIDFLADEDLTPPATDMYGIMPSVCFV